MNPSDSKKLEEIMGLYADKSGKLFNAAQNGELIDIGAWLLSRLADQNREIAGLREENNSLWAQKDMQHKLEKAGVRFKELEEAIRQHQERDWSEKSPPYSDWDEELYALLKVKEEKKELPKFKDIIGLFVDKPEEEKG